MVLNITEKESVNMDSNSKRTKLFSKIWNTIVGIGVICAFVVSIFTIWNEITKPKPPELSVRFALSGTSSVLFAPAALSADDFNWNEPLPLGLLITNTGGTATEDAVLRLIHPKNFELSSKIIQINQQDIYTGNLERTMTTIQLPSIHPGETLHFDKGLYTSSYDPTRIPDKVFEDINGAAGLEFILPKKFVDNTPPSIISISNCPPNADAGPDEKQRPSPATYEIEARISARNIPEMRTSLYITVGPIESLKSKDDPVFVIDSAGKLYRYKR
ncbi:MAG: hypothetical protein ABSH16_01025 [Sedimentisphaerales bacterium]